MQRTVLVFPFLPDKTDADARRIADRFQQQPAEYAESRRRLGVSLERAYLQKTPMGNFVVAYVESEGSFEEVTALTLASDLPVDKFFVDTVLELHGIDLTQPPPGPPPETIGAWSDPDVSTRGRGMAFTAPLLPGVADAGRAFIADAFTRADLTRSRRALHLNLEVVTITSTPQGEIAAVYLEGQDPFAANAAHAVSDDPFDVWFRAELAKLFPPFVDFAQPVAGVTEIFDSATTGQGMTTREPQFMIKADLEKLDDTAIAAWDTRDADSFVALLAEDFVWLDDTMPGPMKTAEEARQYMRGWFTAFPDMRSRETNRVVGEDAVAVEVEFTGTNTGPMNMGGQQIPATGRAVTGRGSYFARARDGKIVEFHSHPDAAGMMMQLGLLPG
jgi:Ketosteroid isomerase-related protein